MTEILNILIEGQTRSLQEVADLLETEIPIVKAQLEFLERQGYIQRAVLNTECSQGCHGCKGCSQSTAASVMWELAK